MTKSVRFILITQGVSRVTLPLIKSNHQICGIIESAPRNYRNKSNGVLFKVLSSIYRLFNRSETLENLARKNHIPYFFMTSNSDSLEEWIRSINPDLIVVQGMSQLLKSSIFSLPKLGTINLHTSLLPKYRGPNPDFWHYYNMDREHGVTIHYIDKGEDTGDILCQETIELPLGIRSPQRLDILIGDIGLNLLFKSMEEISDGSKKGLRQSTESSTPRARNISTSEHANIIDWDSWQGIRIWHLLRGTELWLNALPKPKGIYFGHRWKIAEFIPLESKRNKVGHIYKDGERYYVQTLDGRIYLNLEFKLRKLIIGLLLHGQ
ncbi:methionyl-tRNA formyltransferase [Vibrio mediterranei]|uniref:Methionyl-tRNA formyltransferase n=1 Tax=Vibrio mediterranei TaxID=689 RepID=A0ABX5DGC3_9VIBR|nr:formyltransferase family protein [Vibrio mediterranei]PCD87717.1 methionyl-tRNA formyltransferase [Vibrio mediterranei]PRQ67341.1 methionyl-tRNA formyltransferase [Vibrio mediterranei]